MDLLSPIHPCVYNITTVILPAAASIIDGGPWAARRIINYLWLAFTSETIASRKEEEEGGGGGREGGGEGRDG